MMDSSETDFCTCPSPSFQDLSPFLDESKPPRGQMGKQTLLEDLIHLKPCKDSKPNLSCNTFIEKEVIHTLPSPQANGTAIDTLSPISTNQTDVQQPLSATNVPPPPTVFTSPHINPQRGTGFLKRAQCVNSFAANLSSEYEDNGRILATGSDVCQPYGLHLNNIGIAASVNCESNTQLAIKDYVNLSRENVMPGSKSPVLEDSERWLVQYEYQRPTSEEACRLEKFDQMIPKMKRKRDRNPYEKKGCKRCSCKKSKCLKLYCECFNAGEYCAAPCTCQNCYNRPDYEDTVLGMRQQIECRNSLAFAPKIVRCGRESPQNSGEDSNQKTPASARHIRGCNCKKSRCLKKYCECYQAGVGCSGGCRCHGCKNVFGKKEEMEHMKSGDEIREDSYDGKMGIDILQPEQHHSDDSPRTPIYQFSNHGRDVPKSRHPTRRHLPLTPGSEISVVSHNGILPQSPQTSDGNYGIMKARGNASLALHDLTPYYHLLSRASAAIASDPIYSLKALRSELCQASGSSSLGSLRWRSSPVIPNVHFSGSKFIMDSDSDNKLFNIPEDETPHILKETHSPIQAVKTSSLNQKHVSPPHNCFHELMGPSSPGLRGGHKYILQSVPSFPPLTPYGKPKKSEK